MSRRRKAQKRIVQPDTRYNSQLVSLLINLIMERGKKSIAQNIVYKAFAIVSEQLQKGDPVDLLLGALENARPKLEVKSRRVGGATYQVPVEIPFDRQQGLALRWMVEYADNTKGTPMHESLAKQIVDAYNNTGATVAKKQEMHKNAQANRAFAHYR